MPALPAASASLTALRAIGLAICTNWTSVRKVKEGETKNDLYAILTTEPNTEVRTIHPKAMPVILTMPEEVEAWMTAPADEAPELQRPPAGRLTAISYTGSSATNSLSARISRANSSAAFPLVIRSVSHTFSSMTRSFKPPSQPGTLAIAVAKISR